MSTTGEPQFDDLAIDYSLGQVLEAFSILEVRQELPKWAVPHIEMVAGTLANRATLPPHVAQAADKATQQQGFTATAIVGGLQYLVANGAANPALNLRSMWVYLGDWRKQLQALRPAPKFTPRGR